MAEDKELRSKPLQKWVDEIEAAEKQLDEQFRPRGLKIVNRYLDKRDAVDSMKTWFNLFHANVNILQSSLYNHLPRPDVNRRFKDQDDDVGRVASLIMERCLMYEIECYPDFDASLKGAIFDRLVPGFGQVWTRYEAKAGEAKEGEEPTIQEERTCVDFVHWMDFLWSPARTWPEVRWVSRILYLTDEECKRRWPGKQIKAQYSANRSKIEDTAAPKQDVVKYARVYEIWDKTSKKQIFLCKECPDILEIKDDPLGLEQFFPCPPPLLGAHSTSNLIPIADYTVAQDQYIELDKVNERIQLLVDACKLCGVYDKNNTGIQNLLTGAENKLIPVENWAMFAERGGVKGAIDWLPLDQVVTTLENLYRARESIKQQLYEVTGIADIVRGATKASETLGAQEIKAEFVGIRLSALQRSVAEFVQDILRIKAELICTFYSDEKIMSIIGTLLPADEQYIQPALALLREDFMRNYRVDVDVDSLTEADWQREKETRIEFLTSVSNYLREAVPAAQGSPEMATLLTVMLKFGVAGFKAGREIEGEIDDILVKLRAKATEPPPPPPPDPEIEKAKIKVQADTQIAEGRAQIDLQKAEKDHILQMQKMQDEFALKKMQIEADIELQRQKMQAELQIEREKAQQEMALKNEAATKEFSLKREQMATERAIKTGELPPSRPRRRTGKMKKGADGTWEFDIDETEKED